MVDSIRSSNSQLRLKVVINSAFPQKLTSRPFTAIIKGEVMVKRRKNVLTHPHAQAITTKTTDANQRKTSLSLLPNSMRKIQKLSSTFPEKKRRK